MNYIQIPFALAFNAKIRGHVKLWARNTISTAPEIQNIRKMLKIMSRDVLKNFQTN